MKLLKKNKPINQIYNLFSYSGKYTNSLTKYYVGIYGSLNTKIHEIKYMISTYEFHTFYEFSQMNVKKN